MKKSKKESNAEHSGRDTLKAVSGGAMLRVLRYPFVMLSMAVIPKVMGDSQYGDYSVYMSVFLILDIFSDIGFIQIFGRFVPECIDRNDRQGARDLLHGNLTFGLGITAVLITGLYGYAAIWPIKGLPEECLLILSLQLLFTQIEGILYSFLYSLNQIERYSLKEIYRSAFTFCLVFTLYLSFGFIGALWGLVLNSVALSLIALRWVWPYLIERPVCVSLRSFWPYIIFGVRFYIPCSLLGLIQRSGNVFVKNLSGSSAEVAYYDIGNQFLLLLSAFLGLILSTLIPSLTRLHANDEQDRIDQWQGRALAYCVTIAFCAFNVLVWFGDFVIILVFGAEYAPVYPNAIVVMLGMIMVLLASVGMNYSLLKKQPGVYTMGVTFAVLTMVTGCLLLIPRWHSLGASWSTLAGYTALGGYFMVKYRQHFGSMLKRVGRVVMPALLVCLLFVFKGQHGILFCLAAGLLSTLLFGGLLLVFRAVTREDLRELVRAFRKGS